MIGNLVGWGSGKRGKIFALHRELRVLSLVHYCENNKNKKIIVNIGKDVT